MLNGLISSPLSFTDWFVAIMKRRGLPRLFSNFLGTAISHILASCVDIVELPLISVEWRLNYSTILAEDN